MNVCWIQIQQSFCRSLRFQINFLRQKSDVFSRRRINIENCKKANEIVSSLTVLERQRLRAALSVFDEKPRSPHAEMHGSEVLSRQQIKQLFLVNCLPFVGFGFLDNVIMIVAGEHIDQTLGACLSLSTMAAAALGNTISDTAGVGLTHYVEFVVSRLGLKHPVLNSKQLDSSLTRSVVNGGRALGVVIGCLIGMFPLLFYNHSKSQRESSSKENVHQLQTKEK